MGRPSAAHAAAPHPPGAAAAAAPQPRGGLVGFLQTLIFNAGALAVAYVLLLSGMHKFTHKVWGVELSQDMYLALDKHFVLSTRKAYELLDATLKGHEGLAPLAAVIPRWPHTAWKHLVGGLELWLSFLWMTPKWRTAATGSALVMLSWAALAVFPPTAPTSAAAAKAIRDDELSFACFFLGLCFFTRWIGPPSPDAAAAKQKRR